MASAQTRRTGSVVRKGYRIAHRGYVDTDMSFSERDGGATTITAWVMPEFVYNHAGPVFGTNGSGTFVIGQGDYRSGNGGSHNGSLKRRGFKTRGH